jgi:hypothetical protein
MKTLLIFLAILLQSSSCYAWGVMTTAGGVAAASYADITFYHNCDTLGTTPTKGSGSLTFTAGILSNTTTPIVGSGSWDTNNDGYETVTIPSSSNIDWNDARIGFYFRPFENDAGRVLYSSTLPGVVIYRYDATQYRIQYKDIDFFWTHGMTVDGSVSYFFELVLTGTGVQLFVNGSSVGSATGATGTVTGDLVFGRDDTDVIDMHIDQVIISNDTSRDIYALRNTTSF